MIIKIFQLEVQNTKKFLRSENEILIKINRKTDNSIEITTMKKTKQSITKFENSQLLKLEMARLKGGEGIGSQAEVE